MDILPASRPTNPFGITYLRIPAGRAEVQINGVRPNIVSVPDELFLAFSEAPIT